MNEKIAALLGWVGSKLMKCETIGKLKKYIDQKLG